MLLSKHECWHGELHFTNQEHRVSHLFATREPGFRLLDFCAMEVFPSRTAARQDSSTEQRVRQIIKIQIQDKATGVILIPSKNQHFALSITTRSTKPHIASLFCPHPLRLANRVQHARRCVVMPSKLVSIRCFYRFGCIQHASLRPHHPTPFIEPGPVLSAAFTPSNRMLDGFHNGEKSNNLGPWWLVVHWKWSK